MLYEHRESGEQVDITCFAADPSWSRVTRADGAGLNIRTVDVNANWKQVPNQTVQLSGRADIGSAGES